MRKIFLLAALAGVSLVGCKKKQNDVSTEVTVSFPLISFSGGIYYSIPVGGSLPVIQASAVDTFYKENDSVVLDKSTLDNTTPGLYIVTASAKNKYGFTSYASVYVAVTNVNPEYNLGGTYIRISNSDTVHVTKLATGLYTNDNFAGTTNAAYIVPAYFVQADDTTLILPSQSTAVGTIYGTNGYISMVPSDTVFQYVTYPNPPYGTVLRQFLKL